MSATKTEAKAEFRCSCGRTFAHEISLKRHCWVTGHTAEEVVEAPAAAVAPVVEVAPAVVPSAIELPARANGDAVEEAMRILREKRQAQEAFELRKERERQVRLALESASAVVHQGLSQAAEVTHRGVAAVRNTTLALLRVILLVIVCGTVMLAGMGVGRLMSTPAEASPLNGQRQLVGAQSMHQSQ